MDKLNIFAAHYPEGSENRLTWALLTLVRLAPMACTAFLDLVRTQQGTRDATSPIASLALMRGCEMHVSTQVAGLTADSGRLVAVGITSEGRSTTVPIEPRDQAARYDGVITFQQSPEPGPDKGRGDSDVVEPLMLTIESKLGPNVPTWQLGPSAAHLHPDDEGTPAIRPDKRAVVLAWRDIFRAFTDLGSRNLLNPSEGVLVNDFLEYVRYEHSDLNPFDRFALCRGDVGLLNRRCEEILREVEPNEAWAGSDPIIRVESSSFQRIYLWAVGDGPEIRLGLWPGDTMAQARAFWPRVNPERLKALKSKSWKVRPNLHFSRIQRHFHWADWKESRKKVDEYIDYWKDSHEQEIQSCYRDASSNSFRHEWEALLRQGFISADDVEKLDQQTTPTKHDRISMSPGLGLEYAWSRAEAERLDAQGAFAEEVRRRIREATETWGEIPQFCEQTDTRTNAPADA